jgi:hypothetical protein
MAAEQSRIATKSSHFATIITHKSTALPLAIDIVNQNHRTQENLGLGTVQYSFSAATAIFRDDAPDHHPPRNEFSDESPYRCW